VFGAGKTNPNLFTRNTHGQRSHEIVFNMGLALYKTGKYEKAFSCFEKASLGPVSSNPKLWYYMSLSALNINKSLFD